MQVQVTGKNLSVGDALKLHVENRLSGDVARYFDGAVRAHVTVEKQRSQFHAECTLHLPTGIILQASGMNADAHMSFDAAAAHLERQLKRYKNRLKDHQRNRREPVATMDAASYVLEADTGPEADLGDNPAIIAETKLAVPELTVAEAAMQLDISTTPFLMFRNAGHGGVNLVFRRGDGHIGWIDPGAAQTRKT
jgi:ribosomal subunit interface protein